MKEYLQPGFQIISINIAEIMLLTASDSMGDGVQLSKDAQYLSDETENELEDEYADNIYW